MNGKRRLTLKQVPALARGFGLDSQAQVFLQTLIQFENARCDEERNLYSLWLNDLAPGREYKILELEQYHLIADWVHMAILTLTKIEGIEITPDSVSTLVGGKVTPSQAHAAIERLIDLGLLRREGASLRPTQSSVRTKDDVSSSGAREYHRQVARLAIEATEEQDPSIREMQSFSLALPRSKLALAKDLIRKFRHQFVQLVESEPGDDVYQCNLHFFRLTERPSTAVESDRRNQPSYQSTSPNMEIL